MKKILIVVFAILVISPVMANAFNVYVEGGGDFSGYGVAKYQFGGVGAISFEVLNNFTIGFKYMGGGSDSEIKKLDVIARGEVYDSLKTYSHMNFLGTIGYQYPVLALPLFITAEMAIGMSQVKIKDNYTKAGDKYGHEGIYKSDKGVFIGGWLGAKYQISQHIGLFALAGYQYVTGFGSSRFMAKNVSGMSLQMGVTFSLLNTASIADGF